MVCSWARLTVCCNSQVWIIFGTSNFVSLAILSVNLKGHDVHHTRPWQLPPLGAEVGGRERPGVMNIMPQDAFHRLTLDPVHAAASQIFFACKPHGVVDFYFRVIFLVSINSGFVYQASGMLVAWSLAGFSFVSTTAPHEMHQVEFDQDNCGLVAYSGLIVWINLHTNVAAHWCVASW